MMSRSWTNWNVSWSVGDCEQTLACDHVELLLHHEVQARGRNHHHDGELEQKCPRPSPRDGSRPPHLRELVELHVPVVCERDEEATKREPRPRLATTHHLQMTLARGHVGCWRIPSASVSRTTLSWTHGRHECELDVGTEICCECVRQGIIPTTGDIAVEAVKVEGRGGQRIQPFHD